MTVAGNAEGGRLAANTAKLAALPGETAARRFQCTRCGGVADASAAWWWNTGDERGGERGYERGYAAGRAEAFAEFRSGAASGWRSA